MGSKVASNNRIRKRIIPWIAFIGILGLGIALRFHYTVTAPLKVDEAESSINALTILELGLPRERYLGLPVYENTFIEPWPENEEYEFRDSSYSNKGLAIYHGWFPLYSIAGALKLFGIEPDKPSDPPKVQHGVEEMVVRKIIPRLPALLFGLCFMILMFVAGRCIGGVETGWVALVVAAIVKQSVAMGGQARYYSATAMFSIGCGLWLWKITRKGRWRDFIIFGIMLVFLFHTHILSCMILCCLFGLMIPTMINKRYFFWKGLVTVAIMVLGVLPWIIYTGFLDRALKLPSAISMMIFPEDLLQYLKDNLGLALPPLVAFIWFSLAILKNKKLPKVVTQPILNHRFAILFLALWVFLGFIGFVTMMPAASYFPTRLSLILAVPSTLLTAIVISSLVQMLSSRLQPLFAYSMMLFYLVTTNYVNIFDFSMNAKSTIKAVGVVDYLQRQDFKPGTRIYAYPSYNLVYAYYTGAPIQSIAPIRKSFLDSYQHDILLIKSTNLPIIGRDEMLSVLDASGKKFSPEEADKIKRNLLVHLFCEEDPQRLAIVEPPPQPLPPYLQPTLAWLRAERDARRKKHAAIWTNLPLMRGFDIHTYEDWWQIFFYRFVEPQKRSGEKVNYHQLIKHAKAVMISDVQTVVYHTSGAPLNSESRPNQFISDQVGNDSPKKRLNDKSNNSERSTTGSKLPL